MKRNAQEELTKYPVTPDEFLALEKFAKFCEITNCPSLSSFFVWDKKKKNQYPDFKSFKSLTNFIDSLKLDSLGLTYKHALIQLADWENKHKYSYTISRGADILIQFSHNTIKKNYLNPGNLQIEKCTQEVDTLIQFPNSKIEENNINPKNLQKENSIQEKDNSQREICPSNSWKGKYEVTFEQSLVLNEFVNLCKTVKTGALKTFFRSHRKGTEYENFFDFDAYMRHLDLEAVGLCYAQTKVGRKGFRHSIYYKETLLMECFEDKIDTYYYYKDVSSGLSNTVVNSCTNQTLLVSNSSTGSHGPHPFTKEQRENAYLFNNLFQRPDSLSSNQNAPSQEVLKVNPINKPK